MRPSSSCVYDLPNINNPVSQFARELVDEAKTYMAKVKTKERTIIGEMRDAKFEMDNSITIAQLDAARIICRNWIKQIEDLVAEATALVAQVDLNAIGNVISRATILTAAQKNSLPTRQAHEAKMQYTKNYIEFAVEHLKYTITCLNAYAGYELGETDLEYLLCRAYLIGDLDMDVVPAGHEDRLQTIMDQETEARKEALRVSTEAGARLGFPLAPRTPEESEEEDEEMYESEEDDEQAGWEDDREWDDENGRWK